MSKREAKEQYFEKLKNYIDSYQTVFVVNVDNVGSNQMHQIRHSLRGQAVVLMGKNTMVRRAFRTFVAERPELDRLMPHVKGNIGFVFTNGDLKEIRNKITENRVAAPARANAIAPGDVYVPAGNTGMEPGKTSFFQALGIPTKISRGTIEIVSDVQVVTGGERVGPSEAVLLNMLNISPFTYGMSITQVFDNGTAFSPEVLDVEESSLVANLVSALRDVAAISLAVGYPTAAAVPHSIINGYKNLLAVSVATDYTFEGSEKIKEFLENPDAFVVAAPVAAAADTGAAKEEAKVEEEDESDEDMGFGLFD
ncbi:ribosomal protein L10-domain-containing protein [Fennellomyces sp. T-0311]|nr:ribosomal protein L10-domain-containing protein [Fennellomyces sp. T-0311]